MSLSRIQKLVATLVGDETTLPGNIFFIGRDRQSRQLEYAVDLVRPALPFLVFRPLVELSIDTTQCSITRSGCRQGEWKLQCLVLGPKFLTNDSLNDTNERQTGLGADLVLGEDGNLYVLDWSDTWVETPDGPITYRARTRRYDSFKDAFEDGWGPVEYYIQQIENRLETVAEHHQSLPQSKVER